MKVTAILTMLDEADILPAALDHLRDIGVETTIVVDFGSSDGSLEIVADYERAGDTWLLRASKDDPDEKWARLRVRLGQATGADRVFFLDTDEFWLPRSGSLHDLGDDIRTTDILTVERYNVVLGSLGPMAPTTLDADRYGDILLHAQAVPDLHEHLQAHPEAAWLEGQLEPKIMARPESIEALHGGNHEIDVVPGEPARRAMAGNMIIAHLPFRSFEQFERKARNVKGQIEMTPDFFVNQQGWQWQRWARMVDDGTLEDEWQRQVVSSDQVATLRATGMIRSATEVLEVPIPDYPDEAAYVVATQRAEPWIRAAGAVCREVGIPAGGTIAVHNDGLFPTVRVPPDRIVKFYGPWRHGHGTQEAEVEALGITGRDPELPLPRLIASGTVSDEWRYTVMSVVGGAPLSEVREAVSAESMGDVAAWTGDFVRRLHGVSLEGLETERPLRYFADVIRKRRQEIGSILLDGEVLPRHLAEQAEGWMPTLGELGVLDDLDEPALLHADLHDGHVFGRHHDDRFVPTGIIDLNRARLGHRLYELGPVWCWLFRGDGRLMNAFLDTADFRERTSPGFARIALAWCLLHQGVAQTGVRFAGIDEVADLDELAARSFEPAAS